MKTLFTSLTLVFLSISLNAQYAIEPPKGYTNDIGNMISMLDNLKQRVERIVTKLDTKQTDFLLDDRC